MTQIRACAPDDAETVSCLLGQLGYRVEPGPAAERIRQLAETEADPIFLAVADGQVVGVVATHRCRMVQYEKPVLRVTALVVDGRARRRGIGKMLMRRAESLAAATGCEFIELTSAADRADAHAFYRAIGYEANSVRFRKALTGPGE
jgi:GNAT superfamily N-acetyltransferase